MAEALYFLIPGVHHHLLTLCHGPWPHSAALEVSIIDWLGDVPLSGGRCEPGHQHELDDDGQAVHELARHLVDDHWWVLVLSRHAVITGGGISGTVPGASIAIARIKGSGRRLRYTTHDSARFNRCAGGRGQHGPGASMEYSQGPMRTDGSQEQEINWRW